MEGSIPKILKTISIVYYVIGGFLFLIGLTIIGFSLYELPGSGLAGLALIFGIAISIPMLLMGFLYLFIGRGLLRKQKWSRIVAIVLAFLSVLSGINRIIFFFTADASLNSLLKSDPSLTGFFLSLIPSLIPLPAYIYLIVYFFPFLFHIIAGSYLMFSEEIRIAFSYNKNSKKETAKHRKGSKRKYLYAVLVLLMLSIYAYVSSQKNLEIQMQAEKKPDIPSDLKHLDRELPPEVQKCQDVFHSSDAIPASQRDTCYYKLAMDFKNPRICLEIEPNLYIHDCYDIIRIRSGL